MSDYKEYNKTTAVGFDQTIWTVVLQAAGHQNHDAGLALEKLCQIYWPPIYSFLRRQGQSTEDAKDLTQGFFCHLLDKNRLDSVEPAKGKFRSFLLACLKNYVRNELDKKRAGKRVPENALVHIPISEDETGYWEPVDKQEPDAAVAFERNWAARLLDHVFEKLKEKSMQEGKLGQFEVLASFLTGDASHGDYADAATSLKISEGAARVAATRLRQQFREILQTEVGRTVADPSEIRGEITYLIGILRRP